MNKAFVEDKTCRICGTVDKKNMYIFDPKQKALLYKILTIFPITMYESDPLPKNICKRCSANVTNMHDECQRLVKVQQKWVERVRINQPDHPYVTVLNIVEECHQNMLNKIKQVAPDFIYKNIRLLPSDIPADDECNDPITSLQKTPSISTENLDAYQESVPKIKNLNSLSFDYDVGGSGNYSDSNGSNVSLDHSTIGNRRRNSFKEIQHKLESNGCTLLVKNSSLPDVKPKLPIHKFRLTVHCMYCGERFPNQKFLAKHQLMHLSISDRRIFDKKCLEKSVRRGRLIPVDDKKCIRCLNCWKLFEDNRKILEHWSNADCEFFCQICGMEFARNPKQLREHVPEVHGITYKSSRRQVANFPEVRILNKSPLNDIKPSHMTLTMPKLQPQVKNVVMSGGPPAKKSKLSSTAGRVTCNLCSCTFPNYQSKNSHMRAHKGATTSSQVAAAKARIEDDGPPLLRPVDIKKEKDYDGENRSEPEFNDLLINMSAGGDLLPVKSEKFDDDEMEAEPSQMLLVGDVQNAGSKDMCVPSLKLLDANLPSTMAPVKKLPVKPNIMGNNAKSQPAKKLDQDYMEYDKIYNCHPCGKKFTSKTDLFQHKRLCQSNNKFGCRFCLRAFVTSADLQMHIMLMHKGN